MEKENKQIEERIETFYCICYERRNFIIEEKDRSTKVDDQTSSQIQISINQS